MPRSALQKILALIAAAVGVLVAFIIGLFAYVNATAKPLHADVKAVPSVARAAPSPPWIAAAEQGRQIVRAAIVAQNLPGASVAVGGGGDIVWAEGFGFADLDRRVNVTPETRFRIADVSNTFTSVGVGKLVEKRRLNLDAEIHEYVPSFPEKQWPLTVRELMGHVGGIRNDEGDEEPLEVQCARPLDGVQRFANEPLRFEPGTRYRISSYGWILVSAAVEAAANEPFHAFMRTQVFEPLGMAATRPEAWKEAIPDRATFYYPRFGGDTRYGPDPAREGDQSCFFGAGAFLSTPSDLVRFGNALRSGTLLEKATIDELQAPQRLVSGEETGYGLGWKVETIELAGKPTRMAGHGTKQDFIGGTASLMTFPERGLVVAVTSNISFADTRSIALKIAEAFAAAAPSR